MEANIEILKGLVHEYDYSDSDEAEVTCDDDVENILPVEVLYGKDESAAQVEQIPFHTTESVIKFEKYLKVQSFFQAIKSHFVEVLKDRTKKDENNYVRILILMDCLFTPEVLTNYVWMRDKGETKKSFSSLYYIIRLIYETIATLDEKYTLAANLELIHKRINRVGSRRGAYLKNHLVSPKKGKKK